MNAVLPVILVAVAGYALRALNMVDSSFVGKGNRICFRVLLPLTLFMSLYDMDLSVLSNWKLPLFAGVSIVGTALLLSLIVPLFVKDRRRVGSMVQAMFRGNYLILGFILAQTMYGEEGLAPVVLIMPISIGLYNICAVTVLSHFGETGKEHSLKNTLVEIAKNPLIFTSVLGVVWAALKIPLPTVLAKPLDTLGGMASPLALLMLGASFDFGKLKGNLRPALACTSMRLVVIPAILLPIAALIGFRGAEMGALFILICAPTAVSSFIMADTMGCDSNLAGQLVVLTTFCSAFTLFAGAAILRALAWI